MIKFISEEKGHEEEKGNMNSKLIELFIFCYSFLCKN